MKLYSLCLRQKHSAGDPTIFIPVDVHVGSPAELHSKFCETCLSFFGFLTKGDV